MSNRTAKSRIPPSTSSSIPVSSQQQSSGTTTTMTTPTPPTPVSTSAMTPSSKFPKFLQKQKNSRGARSTIDPAATGIGSSASIASSSSSSVGSNAMDTPTAAGGREKGKKSTRWGGLKEEVNSKPLPVPVPVPQPHAGDTSIDSNYSLADISADMTMDSETPVIIEPVPLPTPSNPFPRPRTRSERPISDIGYGHPPSSYSAHHHSSLYSTNSPSASSSTSRIGDLPTRLSGWFSHTFSSSSTDLSLPSLLSQSSQLSSGSSSSPSSASITSPSKAKSASSALLTAARHGGRHLDKAVRYLLDSDAQPDKCTDPIWILGVKHPGYEPTQMGIPAVSNLQQTGGGSSGGIFGVGSARRRSSVSVDSDGSGYGSAGGSIYGASRKAPSSYAYRGGGRGGPPSPDLSLSQSQPPPSSPRFSHYQQQQQQQQQQPGHHWPPIFYLDFTSRIWLTYRSQFPVPIRDTSLGALEDEFGAAGVTPTATAPPASPTSLNSSNVQNGDGANVHSGRNGESAGGGGRGKGLGGKWNWVGALPAVVSSGIGSGAVSGGDNKKTWTSDSGWGCMLRTGQSLLANALLHMHLGRDWRRPPHPLPTADYALYVQILTWFLDSPNPLAPFSVHRMALAGKELGTDVGCWFGPSVAAGAIKTLVHAFPEAGLGVSVATDGCVYQSEVFAASSQIIGSPSSSNGRKTKAKDDKGWGGRAVLVLVGIRLGLDGVNPIYYDTIKTLYTFPQSVGIAGGRPSSSYYFVGSQADNLFYLDPHHARPAVPLRSPPTVETPPTRSQWERQTSPERRNPHQDQRRRSPNSNSPHQRAPTSPSSSRTGGSTASSTVPLSPSPLQKQVSSSSQSSSSLPRAPGSPGLRLSSSDLDLGGSSDRELDVVQEHYTNAYSAAELKTFHCDRVRKMPLSGLDPSMLLGFLCKDKEDWDDFRRRVNELGQNHKTIFTIQDEPPTWPSDSDEFMMGLESISEPDDMDMDDEVQDGGDEPFFETREDTRSPSTSPDAGTKGSDFDTEEDPMGPITPRTTSDAGKVDDRKGDVRHVFHGDEEDDDDDDWVDPSLPTPMESSTIKTQAPAMAQTISNGSTSSNSSSGVKVRRGSKRSVKRKSVAAAVLRTPEPSGHFPFPSSVADTPQQEDYQQQRDQSPETHENGTKQQRMHTARARDGGRTQSGGVKGVLTAEDSGET